MSKNLLVKVIFMFSFLLIIQLTFSQEKDSFTIVYNNLSSDKNLENDWGFAVWIEIGDEVVLFDTGTKSEILQNNLKRLRFNPEMISSIVISHEHRDHAGGLVSVLKAVKPGTKVYLPNNFDPRLQTNFKDVIVKFNKGFKKITGNIWISNLFMNKENGILEQALVIEKNNRIIVITGCAHPGIVEMCTMIKENFPHKKLELVTGGFHLRNSTVTDVKEISDQLKSLGFEKVAPSHCTGQLSIEVFKDNWKENFVKLNLGDSYKF